MALEDRARRVIGKDRDALETLVRVIPFLTARLNVVGPQGPDVANVKPPVSNDRIRYLLARERPLTLTSWLSRRSEAAFFTVAFRSRLHQRDISILAVQV